MTEQTMKEYCGVSGGMRFAGSHLLIELWQGENFCDLDAIDRILRQAVADCGATLLSMNLHEFSPYGGISGVGMLAESHITIHTWPEYEYAAMDLFVCGTVDPYQAVPALKEGFKPANLQITEVKRGILQ
jgi:S-adenosylmethionine decarboxylase